MNNNLPLYAQLKNTIIKQIENELKENDKINSENELMEMYNVSRTTVRRALKELVDEGILYSVQGVGTFVKSVKDTYEFGSYSGFSKRMRDLGFDVNYVLLEEKVIKVNKHIASKLEIAENDDAFYLERVGIRDQLPMNCTSSYIPYYLVKGIESNNFEYASLYGVLENKFGIQITRTVRYIEAIQTDYHLSETLKISEGRPILKFNGYVYGKINDEEMLVEYFVTYYRTDITKFYIEEKVAEKEI